MPSPASNRVRAGTSRGRGRGRSRGGRSAGVTRTSPRRSVVSNAETAIATSGEVRNKKRKSDKTAEITKHQSDVDTSSNGSSIDQLNTLLGTAAAVAGGDTRHKNVRIPVLKSIDELYELTTSLAIPYNQRSNVISILDERGIVDTYLWPLLLRYSSYYLGRQKGDTRKKMAVEGGKVAANSDHDKGDDVHDDVSTSYDTDEEEESDEEHVEAFTLKHAFLMAQIINRKSSSGSGGMNGNSNSLSFLFNNNNYYNDGEDDIGNYDNNVDYAFEMFLSMVLSFPIIPSG